MAVWLKMPVQMTDESYVSLSGLVVIARLEQWWYWSRPDADNDIEIHGGFDSFDAALANYRKTLSKEAL